MCGCMKTGEARQIKFYFNYDFNYLLCYYTDIVVTRNLSHSFLIESSRFWLINELFELTGKCVSSHVFIILAVIGSGEGAILPLCCRIIASVCAAASTFEWDNDV